MPSPYATPCQALRTHYKDAFITLDYSKVPWFVEGGDAAAAAGVLLPYTGTAVNTVGNS